MKRNRGLEMLLLLLAALPLAAMAFAALHIWFNGETQELNWKTPTWSLVAIQIVALVAFFSHLAQNEALAEDESSQWSLEFLLYQNIGMLNYWVKHVWGQSTRPRP